MSEKTILPKGVVAILIRPDDYAPVVAAHFDLNRPGGYSLKDAQKHYATEAVARKLIEEFCGWPIRPAIRQFDASEIMRSLISSHGWKLHFEFIGHDEEQPE